MDDFVEKILNDKMTDEEANALRDKLGDEGKKSLDQALGFRNKRKDEENKANDAATRATTEEKRAADAKVLADAEEARLSQTRTETTQFRSEQISKAKSKFFAEYGITDPVKQAEYEAQFPNLDTGKLDPDLIFKDFERTHVSLNSDSYLEAERKQREMNRNADDFNRSGAGPVTHAPPGNDPPKFSETAKKMAQESNITEEAASRIEKEGYTRSIEG